MLKGRHLDPFVTFEVTVKVKVKLEDLGEEDQMLHRILLREEEKKNLVLSGWVLFNIFI